MSKNRPPAFQFHADDFITDVSDMTQAEVGAYIMLLSMQWTRGSIPTDPERQRMLAKGDVTPYVLSKFKLTDDGNLVNLRLEMEREKQEAYRASRSENGKHGGRPRKPCGKHVVLKTKAQESSPSPSPSPVSVSVTNSDSDCDSKDVGQNSDAEWLLGLRQDKAYAGIDVDREHSKMVRWCSEHKKQATRRRFINWLNRCDKPLSGSARNPEGRQTQEAIPFKFI